MSCMTTAQDITMTTTRFARELCYESCMSAEEMFIPRHQPPRMNWVVVTDEDGNRRLQIDWHAGRDD